MNWIEHNIGRCTGAAITTVFASAHWMVRFALFDIFVIYLEDKWQKEHISNLPNAFGLSALLDGLSSILGIPTSYIANHVGPLKVIIGSTSACLIGLAMLSISDFHKIPGDKLVMYFVTAVLLISVGKAGGLPILEKFILAQLRAHENKKGLRTRGSRLTIHRSALLYSYRAADSVTYIENRQERPVSWTSGSSSLPYHSGYWCPSDPSTPSPLPFPLGFPFPAGCPSTDRDPTPLNGGGSPSTGGGWSGIGGWSNGGDSSGRGSGGGGGGPSGGGGGGSPSGGRGRGGQSGGRGRGGQSGGRGRGGQSGGRSGYGRGRDGGGGPSGGGDGGGPGRSGYGRGRDGGGDGGGPSDGGGTTGGGGPSDGGAAEAKKEVLWSTSRFVSVGLTPVIFSRVNLMYAAISSTAVMAIGFLLFLCCIPLYHRSVDEDTTTEIYRVSHTRNNRLHRMRHHSSTEDDRSTSQPHRSSVTNFLSVGKARKAETSRASSRETMSARSPVEQQKPFLMMIPMWTTFLVIGLVLSTGSTLFAEEASTMKPTISIYVLLMIRNIISPASSFFLKLLVKFINKRLKIKCIIGGIMIAMGLSVFCSIAASRVEVLRLNAIMEKGLCINEDEDAVVPLSILLLAPQFCLLALTEGIGKKGLELFFDVRVSDETMRKYGSELNEAVVGLGSFINVLLVFYLRSWFRDNLNCSRLKHYYEMLMVLSFVNLFYSWLVSTFYLSVTENDVE